MKYICYYDTINNYKENRNYALAATNKMDYIISVLNKLGINVDLISASRCMGKHKGKGRTEEIGNGNTLKIFSSIGGNKFIRGIDKIKHSVLFFNWLLFNIRKGESIICYHSLGYYKIISLLKKIKKFKLILEVEEIYADVINNSKLRNSEIKYFEKADAYIFPTELLNDLININKKPYVITHGTYKVETDRKCKFDDGKIHIVYAGTFDPRKGGALAATTASMFLDDKYHIHILGFGSDEEVKKMEEVIMQTNKNTKCSISYEGLKSGEDYIRFIQSCDIGLSTQYPKASFNATSFPSKILSYMANGLRVVSIRIPVVEKSAIGKYLFYYDKQTAEEVANAIMSINIAKDYDSRNIISNLDKQFQKEINNMLEELE